MLKLFKLPTPKELGSSTSNALSLRRFTPWEKGYCWEDWHKEVKEKYPIRYFLIKTFPQFIKHKCYFPFAVPISELWYKLVSHTVPKRKYHLLDLRQPCSSNDSVNLDCYRYGWCDVPEKMLYAMFNLLKEYFNEKPFDLTTEYSKEEIEADISMKQQQFYYDEAKAILHWWQVERKQETQEIDKLLSRWSDARKDDTVPDDGETKFHWLQLQYAEKEFEKKTDEMISRLMRIRRGLWT